MTVSRSFSDSNSEKKDTERWHWRMVHSVSSISENDDCYKSHEKGLVCLQEKKYYVTIKRKLIFINDIFLE